MVTTTNLNIRTDKAIKDQAEAIFNELGLNMTTAINIFLRTAIREHGIPFSLTLPSKVPTRDEMTTAQFNQMMATGLQQAKADESFDVDDVFDDRPSAKRKQKSI